MEDDNLLLALSKYHPREGHTPLENFITEAFAWLLRNNPAFTVEFFKELCEEPSLSEESEIKIKTQLSWNGNYPDDEYELYEHYKESYCNEWHPLYIRKSLLDIFTGIETQEEQVSKLLEENKKLLRLLNDCPSFGKLRTKYST